MLAAVLFGIGAVGVLVRRNPLVMFMCIELMLNAVNLSFVALSTRLGDIDGQTAVFFVLVVAAAEVVVGLGIIVSILRRRPGATADDLVDDGLEVGERRCERRGEPAGRRPSVIDVVWLIPALPLAGFLLILLFGRRLGEPVAGYLATAMVGGSFVVTVGVFIDLLGRAAEERPHVVSAVRVGAGRHAARSTWRSSPTR